jgi:hypothetical protein
MAESKLTAINAVYVSPHDLSAVLALLSQDKNPWPRLLLDKAAFNAGEVETDIVSTVEVWLYNINNDIGGAASAAEPRIVKAARILFQQGEAGKEEVQVAACALVYRVSAFIRLVLEHIVGRSRDRRSALTSDEKNILSNAHLHRLDFVQAACLASVKEDGGRPAFDLDEFTEKLRQVRVLRASDR